jgi:hypothetical protein
MGLDRFREYETLNSAESSDFDVIDPLGLRGYWTSTKTLMQ